MLKSVWSEYESLRKKKNMFQIIQQKNKRKNNGKERKKEACHATFYGST